MRIGIDALSVVLNRTAGGETYLTNLVRNLAKIDNRNQYFLFVCPSNREKFTIKQPNFASIVCKIPAKYKFIRVLWEQAFLPWQILGHKIDVMHFPANTSSMFVPCKSIATIHDLSSFYYAEKYPGYEDTKKLIYLNTFIRLTSRNVNTIIADSHFTKESIVKYLSVRRSKIKIVYLGAPVKKGNINASSIDSVLQHYGINSNYILCVSSMQKHKNFDGLLKAFAILKKKYQIHHKLVFVGKPGNAYSELLDMVKKLNLEEMVIMTKSYIPGNHIPALYSAADVFVLPASYEGFGLTPLEAMAFGVPVASSSAASLPEVVGNAAVLFNPFNIDDMVDAIYRALSDLTLREELVKKGYERVRQFSWEETARKTLELYEQIYSS